MVTYFVKWEQPINMDLLRAELEAALGDLFAGIVFDGEKIGAHFDDSAGEITQEVLSTAMGVLEAHDWTKLTPEQEQAEQDADTARQLAEIIDARIAWHNANPVTGANAVEFAARIQEEWVYFLHLLRSGQFGL